MNNDGNGSVYRNNTTMDFEKGDVVGRALTNKNYNSSISKYLDKDNMETDLTSLMKYTEELEKINDKSKKRNDLIKEFKRLQEDLAKAMLNESNDEKDILKLNEKIQTVKIKAAKDYLKISNLEIKSMEQQLEVTKELSKVREKLAKINWADNLSKGLKDLSKELGDLSKTLNIDKLVNGGTEALRSVRRDTMASMNLSSNQFQDFKNNLLREVRSMNDSIGSSLFGLDDVTWYLSNLNQMGIYSTTLAEQQVNAAIVGNKLLGMSIETQAQFIKVMKRTDNKDLLQQQNETIATLLKSSLDVSKEQLALAAGNTADLLDKMSYMGADQAAIDRMNRSATAGQASLISTYDVDTNNAIYSILSDLYNNPYSQYYAKGNGAALSAYMQNGEYGTAVEVLMQSDWYRSLAQRTSQELGAMLGRGDITGDELKLINAIRSGKGFDRGVYDNVMGMSQDKAKQFLEDVKKGQAESLTFQEKLENWLGLFLGQINWKWTIGLADTAFALYIASKTLDVFKWLKSALPKVPGVVTTLTGRLGTIMGNGGAVLGHLAPMATALIGIVAAVGAVALISKDIKQAQENGASGIEGAIFGTRDGISNVLMNGLKGLLVGIVVAIGAAALGITAGVSLPLIGIIAAVGALLGLIGNILGIAKKKDTVGGYDGGTALGGIGGDTSPNTLALTGAKSIKPWGISSRFGPRSYWDHGKLVHDNHKGIDLTSKSGTPIGANAPGYVIASGTGWSGGRGNYVSIKDASGLKHTYMHMIQPTHLKKGDYVNAGQIVGYMGSTGHSTGTHLHYQIDKGNKAINPESFLTSNLVKATAFGNTNNPVAIVVSTNKRNNNSGEDKEDNLLGKFIAADTRQKDATAQQYANYFATETGVGGPTDGTSGITGTVNKGFGDLISKLDELSAKQEDQERVLAALTGKTNTSLYRY